MRRTLIRNLAQEEGPRATVERLLRPEELGEDFDGGMAIVD